MILDRRYQVTTRTTATGAWFSSRTKSLGMRLFPIIFFVSYLNLSVFLFAFGPWLWPVHDGTKLYLFLACVHFSLLLGYLSAAFKKPGGYFGKWNVGHFFALSLLANLILMIPTSFVRTGSGIPNILNGLSNPGLAYASSTLLSDNGSLVEYLSILLGPLLGPLIPLTIYYWQKLNWIVKALSVTAIFIFLAIYVANGTNKALADFILMVPFLAIASYLGGSLKLALREICIMLLSGIIFLGLFLWFFTSGQITRPGSGAVAGYFPLTKTFADPDNVTIQFLPSGMKTGTIALINYMTQGYYALYLSLDEPFVPMFGTGNSMFLFRNVSKLTGITEIEKMPYPMRLEEEGKWSAYGAWSSIYPWIASDVSFPGVIIVVFLIGRLFALSWLDSVEGRNPFAIVALSLFVIMLFYFPANNQVLQSGESFTGFWITIVLWLFTRRRLVWRI